MVFLILIFTNINIFSEVLQKISDTTKINWTKGTIEIHLSLDEEFFLDKSYIDNIGHIRRKLRDSIIDKLLIDIEKITLDNNRTIGEFLNIFPDRLKALIKLVYNSDLELFRLYQGKIYGKIMLPIWGRDSIISTLGITKVGTDLSKYMYKSEPIEYTGLLIDIRNMNIKASIMPKIISKSGEIIYSYSSISEEFSGSIPIKYFSSFDAAISSGLLGDKVYLTIPEEIRGLNSNNIVLADSDIFKLLSCEENIKIFSRGSVGIIVRRN